MAPRVQMKRKWALRSRGSLPKIEVLAGQVRLMPQGVHALVPLTHRDHPIGTLELPSQLRTAILFQILGSDNF